MRTALTAREFRAMTGLTATALGRYAEWGVVVPDSVDPVSGDRFYARDQLRHAAVVELLRHARVPVPEPASAAGSPAEHRRATVRSRVDDLYLDAAERVAAFDPDAAAAHTTLVAPVDWIGIGIALDIPDDAPDDVEGVAAAFGGLFVDVPAVEEAFVAQLADLGVPPAGVSWTAIGTGGEAGERMVLARPGPARLDRDFRAAVTERVHAATGRRVTVVSGALPRRVETTFTGTAVGEPTIADDLADGYLQILAFAEHLARHGLTAISPTAREVTHASRSFGGGAVGRPTTVFDVHPAPGPR